MQKKCIPLIDVNGILSFLEAIDNLQKNADKFQYPFTMMLGEYDDVISNRGAIKWYKNTAKVRDEDKSRIMFQRAAHELHKEPMNAEVVKHAMKFMSKRMSL